MKRLWVRAAAPFAAYRGLQAGVFRGTAPVMPPSAAYGLILNLAGLEMRGDPGKPTTPIRPDLPCLKIAIGAIEPAEVVSLYQQLHGYPVGSSGADLKARTKGAKYWIAPVRRELLVGLDVLLGIEADGELIEQAVAGLNGMTSKPRYGLPFAGDNNLLFDRLEVLPVAMPCRWYYRLDAESAPQRGSCRLTIGIDREESHRTTTALFAPVSEPVTEPPAGAWTWTPRQPAGP